MIWGRTTHVGCGWIQFPVESGSNKFHKIYPEGEYENFFVCNYGVGGNVPGQPVRKSWFFINFENNKYFILAILRDCKIVEFFYCVESPENNLKLWQEQNKQLQPKCSKTVILVKYNNMTSTFFSSNRFTTQIVKKSMTKWMIIVQVGRKKINESYCWKKNVFWSSKKCNFWKNL